jgi:glycosyltransferase involved in cell wall biosynthesis
VTKPRIFIYHNNPDSTGSVVVRIRKTLEILQPDFSIILITPAPGSFLKSCEQFATKTILLKFTENNSLFKYLRAFLNFLWLLIRYQPTVLFIPDYSGWKPAELLATIITRTPFVVSLDFFRNTGDLFGFIKFASAITANSEATGQIIHNSDLKDRLHILHNAIDLSLYPKQTRKAPGSEISIGYLGVLHPIKGIDTLILAAQKLNSRGLKFRVTIGGYEKQTGYRDLLETMVKSLELTEIISFVGAINNQANFFELIDILVVPSRQEPFGYINIEAGACSVPVVASRTGGIPEIIIPEETGLLFEPQDETDLSQKLEKLIREPELISKLGNAARTHVEKNFDLSKKLIQWRELILTVANRSL